MNQLKGISRTIQDTRIPGYPKLIVVKLDMLRGPPQCHLSPQEIAGPKKAGLIKGKPIWVVATQIFVIFNPTYGR